MPSYWIFQGNPDRFDMTTYLTQQQSVVWTIGQKHLAPDMAPGDVVFFWRAAGARRSMAGVIARGVISDSPSVRPDDPASKVLWRSHPGESERLRVAVRLEPRPRGGNHIVARTVLLEEPLLKGMRILKMRNETNYLLSDVEGERLEVLWRTTK